MKLSPPIRTLSLGFALLPFLAHAQVAQIKKDAETLKPLVSTDLAKAFLDATATLPAIEDRKLYRDATGAWYTKEEADKLDEDKRKALKEIPIGEKIYYNTKYGSPLAYVRPLEILGEHGFTIGAGTKILDFGYGTVGHLKLLASMGAEAIGVDVDPLLRTLYSWPGDQGAQGDKGGTVRLIDGFYPSDPAIKSAVGTGYDLIISKNTLKRGYIHPEKPVDDKLLVHLKVEDAEFIKTLFDAVKPGGYVLVYNLSPAQAPADKPYIPWADGRSPFTEEQWKAAGFNVIAFDTLDDEKARAMAHALAWDAGPQGMKLDTDLFTHYTLVQRPSA